MYYGINHKCNTNVCENVFWPEVENPQSKEQYWNSKFKGVWQIVEPEGWLIQ